MKTILKQTTTLKLRDLQEGDTFRIGISPKIFMKIPHTTIVSNLGNVSVNAINLNDGKLYYYIDVRDVTKVDGEFVEK